MKKLTTKQAKMSEAAWKNRTCTKCNPAKRFPTNKSLNEHLSVAHSVNNEPVTQVETPKANHSVSLEDLVKEQSKEIKYLNDSRLRLELAYARHMLDTIAMLTSKW